MGGSGRGVGGRRTGGLEAPVAAAAAAAHPATEPSPASPAADPTDPADRPAASGHRFGPRLMCSECGVRWDVHQRDPQPCRASPPAPDPFARRPPPPR